MSADMKQIVSMAGSKTGEITKEVTRTKTETISPKRNGISTNLLVTHTL